MELDRATMEAYADDWLRVHSEERQRQVGADVLNVQEGPKGTFYVSSSDVHMNDPIILHIKANSIREAIIRFLYTSNELDEEFENDKEPDLQFLAES